MLRIYTLVYGEHLKHWFPASSASLMWPKNMQALKDNDALWDIYTDNPGTPIVEKIVKGSGIPYTLKVMDKGQLFDSLRRAVHEGQRFLFAPPDMMFSDGSIGAMSRVLDIGKHRCVAVGHPRVDGSKFLNKWDGKPMDGPLMVRLAMGSLSGDFRHSQAGMKPSFSHWGGVCWDEIAPRMYGVTFAVPSVHMCEPTMEDVEFLAKAGPGGWDHAWPATLVKHDRLRIIGSSDAAFCVEFNKGGHAPGNMKDPDPNRLDAYKLAEFQHTACRTGVGVWRSA